MPLYTYVCTNDHETEIFCKYSELKETIPCQKISCREPATRSFRMENKPLVNDYDLIKARNHNGKNH